jgi:predicted permease
LDLHLTLLRVVLVMFVMIATAYGLRRAGFFKDGHGAVFTNLVFKVTVPALIVHALATHPLDRTVLDLTLLSGAVGVAGMLVGWLAGVLLRFDRATTGVLILSGGFGNTVFVGFPLITGLYGNNAITTTDAVMISEVSLLLLFTLGVFRSIQFGSGEQPTRDKLRRVLAFFRSPVFIAICIGALWNGLDPSQDGFFVKALLELTHVVGQSTTFLAAIAIGLMLRFDGARKDVPALAVVLMLNLLAHPLLALYTADGVSLQDPNRTVFVLEAAMPVAPLAAVFAGYYDLNTRLASLAIVASLVISPLTILGLLFLL